MAFEFLISLGILFQVMAPVYIMVRLVVLNFVLGGTKTFLDAWRVHRVMILWDKSAALSYYDNLGQKCCRP